MIKYKIVFLIYHFFTLPCLLYGQSYDNKIISNKAKKEILGNIKKQSATLSQYSNEIAGFKVAFSRNKKIDLSLKKIGDYNQTNLINKGKLLYFNDSLIYSYALLAKVNHKDYEPEANYLKADILLKQGLYEKLHALTNILVKRKSKLSDDYLKKDLQGCALNNCKEFQIKLDGFTKRKNKKSDEFLYEMGKMLFQMGKVKEADLIFSKISKSSIKYFKGRFFKVAGLIYKKDYKKALMDLKSLEEELKNYKYHESLVVKQLFDHFYITLGRLCFQTGNYDQAIEWYNKVNRRSNKFNESLEEIAWSLFKMEKYDVALGAIEGARIIGDNKRVKLDILLLKATIYGAKNEYEKALSIYKEIISIYGNIKKEIEDIIYGQTDLERIITSFTLDSEKKMNQQIYDWMGYDEISKVQKLLSFLQDLNQIKRELEQADVLMNKIKSVTLEKRDFIGSFESLTKGSMGFFEFGRKFYEIIQDVREKEQYVLCHFVTSKDCDELKKVSFNRYNFYKKNIIDKEIDKSRPFEKFEELAGFLDEEQTFFLKIRASYNLEHEILMEIDELKKQYLKLNSEYLNLKGWLTAQLMDNYANFNEIERELYSMKMDTLKYGRSLVFKIHNEITEIYSRVMARIGRYGYNVTIGKNEIMWKLKKKYTEEFLAAQDQKNKKIKILNNSFFGINLDEK